MLLDFKLTVFIKMGRKISTFYLNLCTSLMVSVEHKKMPQSLYNAVYKRHY